MRTQSNISRLIPTNTHTQIQFDVMKIQPNSRQIEDSLEHVWQKCLRCAKSNDSIKNQY